MSSFAGAATAAPFPTLPRACYEWMIGAMVSSPVPLREETDRAERAAIDRVLSGDADAFDHLVRKYMRKALSIAWGIVRDAAEAEDVTQEALVKAYRGLGSMRSNEAFASWLFRIVTNLSLDRLRSRNRRRADPLLDVHEARERSDALSGETLAARIDAAIATLPEMQRLAARLYLVEELSHAEIAVILTCSEGTVRSNLSHARKKLQEELRDVYEDLR